MSPWAYDNVRLKLSQLNPRLDIYPLGKVLWSMLTGRNGFPFWEFDKEDNNLEKLFPNDHSMPLVNGLLARCIVREEKDCLSSTMELCSAVDVLIEQVEAYHEGFRPGGAETWPCRVCRKGKYIPATPPDFDQDHGIAAPLRGGAVRVLAQVMGAGVSDRAAFSIYVCDRCGHAELFKSY